MRTSVLRNGITIPKYKISIQRYSEDLYSPNKCPLSLIQ